MLCPLGGKCHPRQLPACLKRPHFQVIFNLAGLLFALGLGATSQTILEQLIWWLAKHG
jgi:hypothetical protein